MDDDLTFDEEKAVSFIREKLTEQANEKYDDDDILYIIDTIWDYYEKKGLLSLDMNEEEDDQLDRDDLIKYVKQELKRSEFVDIDSKEVEIIVKAEMDYEESLESDF